MKQEVKTALVVLSFIALISLLARLQALRIIKRQFDAFVWLRRECKCKHKVGKPVSLRWVINNLGYGSYNDFRKEFLRALKKYAKKYGAKYGIDYKVIMATIDAIGRIEQGNAPMWGYNFFGIQTDLKWKRSDLIDYSFCVVDSGGYCRAFAGFKSLDRVAEFMAYVIAGKIKDFIDKRGEFDAGWFYSCSWWRNDCPFRHDTFASIYNKSLEYMLKPS